jgi:hypothetical protein
MKTTTTNPAPGAYKLSMIGHQYKLVSSEPGSRAEKFSSAMELVRHLNKYKITPQNSHLIPPFYQAMLNEK